jgi:hypothetical protein
MRKEGPLRCRLHIGNRVRALLYRDLLHRYLSLLFRSRHLQTEAKIKSHKLSPYLTGLCKHTQNTITFKFLLIDITKAGEQFLFGIYIHCLYTKEQQIRLELKNLSYI